MATAVVTKGLTDLNRGGNVVMVSEEDLKLYRKYVKTTVKYLNKYVQQHSIPVRIDSTEYEQDLENPSKLYRNRALRGAIGAFTKAMRFGRDPLGRVYRSQIATAAAVIATSLMDKVRNIAINGATQSGKSGTMFLSFCLEPVCHYLVTGEKVIPIVSLVNKNDLYTQFVDDFSMFAHMHENLKIVHLGKRPNSSVPQEMYIGQYFMDVIGHEFYSDPTADLSEGVIKNSTLNVDDVKNIIKKAHALGFKVFDYIDESHYASHKGSVFDQMVQEHIEAANESKGTVDFRAISATNWEHNSLATFRRVPQRYERGYIGVPYFNGMKLPCIDRNYVAKPPALHRYTELGISDIPMTKYESLENFAVRTRKEMINEVKEQWKRREITREEKKEEIERIRSKPDSDFEEDFEEFKATFIASIAKIIKSLHRRDGHGICLRVARSNTRCRDIMNKVRENLKRDGLTESKFLFMEYFGRKENSSFKEILYEENPTLKPYAVFITGGARMGVAFHKSCHHFVDLTDDPTTSTSEIQGTFGRATGYLKESHVWVSDDCYESIDYYIRNEGRPKKRPHMSVIYQNGILPGRPAEYVELRRTKILDMEYSADKQRLLDLFTEMETVIMKQKNDGLVWLQNHKDNAKPLWRIYNKICEIVERHPELCQKGEKDIGWFPEVRPLYYADPHILQQEKVPSRFLTHRGAAYDGKFARRTEWVGKERDMGRTTGGREIITGNTREKNERLKQDVARQAQVYFKIYGQKDNDRSVTSVEVLQLSLTLREPVSRYNNVEVTKRSAWWRAEDPIEEGDEKELES